MAKSKRSAEKESFWRLVLEEFGESGLSVRAFCRQEGLSEPSFYAWRRTLQERDVKRSEAAGDQAKLIPVKVVAADNPVDGSQDSPSLEVITPSGFTLRFCADIQPQQLDAVLGAISRCPGATLC